MHNTDRDQDPIDSQKMANQEEYPQDAFRLLLYTTNW